MTQEYQKILISFIILLVHVFVPRDAFDSYFFDYLSADYLLLPFQLLASGHHMAFPLLWLLKWLFMHMYEQDRCNIARALELKSRILIVQLVRLNVFFCSIKVIKFIFKLYLSCNMDNIMYKKNTIFKFIMHNYIYFTKPSILYNIYNFFFFKVTFGIAESIHSPTILSSLSVRNKLSTHFFLAKV